MFDRDALRERLVLHEGVRLKPYTDTVGKLTIGCGRNLSDRGISTDEMEYLLENDIADAAKSLVQGFPWVEQLDPVRHGVLVEMCFNIGIAGLAKFSLTLVAVKTGNYALAADRMMDSKWARQVGRRAVLLSMMMRTGGENG